MSIARIAYESFCDYRLKNGRVAEYTAWKDLCAEAKEAWKVAAQAMDLAHAGVQSPGVARISVERTRQLKVEGFSHQQDALYTNGELIRAARCYLVKDAHECSYPLESYPSEWPWTHTWWKPSQDPIRNFEKAGALIAAEIDRLTVEKG